MILLPGKHQHTARLFHFLLQGEQLAFDCASQQIRLFEDRASRNFLRNQARQEKFHLRVFKSGIGVLAPRGISGAPGVKAMGTYRRLLEEALGRGDRAETLLGLQVLLEGLGDVTVKHIDSGFGHRKLEFLCRRIRHLITAQEDAHHSFGIKRLQQCFAGAPLPEHIISRSEDYLELLEQLVNSCADLFAHFDEDPRQYREEFYQDLPAWLRGEMV
jgi:hypothetical protein